MMTGVKIVQYCGMECNCERKIPESVNDCLENIHSEFCHET